MTDALPRPARLPLLYPSIVALTASQMYTVWVGGFGLGFLRAFVYSANARPYVYRALLPLLSKGGERLTGIPAVSWLIVLVVACGVGMYYALRYLAQTFIDNADLLAFAGTEAFFILFLILSQPYDVATGFFFALSFALLARGYYGPFLLLFPLATLNRETTFLLVMLWAVWTFRRVPVAQYIGGLLWQIVVYGAVRYATMMAFADNPGVIADFRPLQNLIVYATMPWHTLALVALVAVTLNFVLRGWKDKPLFLRTAFVLLFPLQVVLHLTLGWAFEIRVYAETFPIVLLLVAYGLHALVRNRPLSVSRAARRHTHLSMMVYIGL